MVVAVVAGVILGCSSVSQNDKFSSWKKEKTEWTSSDLYLIDETSQDKPSKQQQTKRSGDDHQEAPKESAPAHGRDDSIDDDWG